jgi:hypothetical protein
MGANAVVSAAAAATAVGGGGGGTNDLDAIQVDSMSYGQHPHTNKRLSSLGTVVAARWTKHHSSLQRIGTKLSKWARSVKKYSCTGMDSTTNTAYQQQQQQQQHPSYDGTNNAVHLDKYLHPPGHDDKMNKQKASSSHVVQHSTTTKGTSHNNNNNRTTTTVAAAGATTTTTTTTNNNNNLTGIKPLPVQDRSLSTASDYDVRMLS